MRSTILASALALVACAPVATLPLPPVAEGGSYMLFTTSADGKIIEGQAYDAHELTERSIIRRIVGTTHTVLVYDASLADMRVLRDGENRLQLVPDSAGPERAWPPETPVTWGVLDDEGFEIGAPEALAAWLPRVRLERPGCQPPPVLRRIPALEELVKNGIELRNVSLAIPLGNHVVFGWSGTDDHDTLVENSPRLFRVNIASGVLEELSGRTGFPLVDTKSGPRGFLDDGRAWILWPTVSADTSSSSYVMRTVNEQGEVGPAVTFTVDAGVTLDDPAHFKLTRLAAGRFEGRRTLVALTDAGALLHFDEDLRRWIEVQAPPHRGFESCGSTVTRILEVDGEGTGLYGVKDGPIARFDLRRGPGNVRLPASDLIDGGPYCRNVRTRLDSGYEVLNAKQSDHGLSQSELAFRPSSDAEWARVEVNTLSGQAIAPYLEGFVASGNVDTVLYFDHEPRRPELPPRACGEPVPVDNNVYTLLRVGPETLFLGGRRGAAFLDTPRIRTSTVIE